MKKSIITALAALALTALSTLPAISQSRYADHSVLASGHWVKIRVPETGFYMLTDELLREAGFSNPSQVKVYGYGGALQPERITASYITSTDDLQEVPTCIIGERRLFHAVGPVTWNTPRDTLRTRNSYSNYGYYFLTENDDTPLVLDSAAFVDLNYPTPADYHSIHEKEEYSWYHGGRNLYEKQTLSIDEDINYELPAYSETGRLTVMITYEGYCNVDVFVNGIKVGQVLVNSSTASKTNKKLKSLPDDYSDATVDFWVFNVKTGLKENNTITLRQTSGGKMRLDYLSLTSISPKPCPWLSVDKFPVPEVVERVYNQDLHADPFADMVIIIPTNRAFTEQAERLKQLHENYDGLKVNIVAADQLYNEFSSGTPDANAYRRYMKMLYDRAGDNVSDRPKFLLLFGDGAWDNRMCSEKWVSKSPDDFLLCYESENSFSETKCYVSDDYFCLLDDNEGADLVTDKIDAAVGRFPARNLEDAITLVNKAYSYVINADAGAWQNTICIMGDDGDKNRHMDDAERVANMINNNYGSFNVKKILWDAFNISKSASADRYPEITTLIKEQMQIGALIMDYSGHGGPEVLSHEKVLNIDDFEAPTSMRMPLWITASCDITPFDGQEKNLGDAAMFNPNGGAIAFFGTTRTVYAAWNRPLNLSFVNYVLGSSEGKRYTIGQAAMKAKNEFSVGSSRDMIINKQQYTLLGDPAITLAAPTLQAVVDEINGVPVSGEQTVKLQVGQKVTVSGHIEGHDDFNGEISFMVKDTERTIKCQRNDPASTDTAMVYKDRLYTLFAGTNSVKDGHFQFSFTVPKDISYDDSEGQILLFGYTEDRSLLAHGECRHFTMTSNDNLTTDGQGPIMYGYLENETFTNGGIVGREPYFYAMISDNEGINTSDASIGHNIELSIDGKTSFTYNLNPYFKYSFGDYTTGTVNFTLPMLAVGSHHLVLKAWDVLNNSSTLQCNFVVADRGIAAIDDVEFAQDPTSFNESYDLQGRRIGNSNARKQIILKRDSHGNVRKMITAGQ